MIDQLQVGDPAICTKISDDLIKKFGHYVQSINYPTVPRGEEKLRIAPTPHHTREMMDQVSKTKFDPVCLLNSIGPDSKLGF